MVRNPNEGSGGPGTVVGVNVALSGTLKDQNDIVVYGMVDGEVISERTVTVGQSAQVKGPIRGQVISVGGTIRGEIDASEKLELLETGKVFGSIRTKDLVVHSGAVLVGQVTMGSDETEESSSTGTEKEAEETDHESVAVEVRTEKDRQDKEETDDEDKSEVELTPDEE